MLKEQDAGMATADVGSTHSFSQGAFCTFKSRYGGIEVSGAAKLRAVTDENAKLKRLLADTMLDNVVLKDLLRANNERQRFVRCVIMTSRNEGSAALLVLIPKLSGVIARPLLGSALKMHERETIQISVPR